MRLPSRNPTPSSWITSASMLSAHRLILEIDRQGQGLPRTDDEDPLERLEVGMTQDQRVRAGTQGDHRRGVPAHPPAAYRHLPPGLHFENEGSGSLESRSR